ncbi:MAG: hypothetical protein IIY19_03880, partial [Lachnospiraceae bacterium]|nr:hypothetical protein [Lachnospiraceae bacterium]
MDQKENKDCCPNKKRKSGIRLIEKESVDQFKDQQFPKPAAFFTKKDKLQNKTEEQRGPCAGID